MKEKSTLRKILMLYKPYKSMTQIVLFGAALSSIISTMWPIITKMIIEECIGQPWSKAEEPFYRYLMILIALALGDIIAQYILSYVASVLTDKIKYGISMDIFCRYLYMGYEYYDNTRTGGIISMIDYDIDKIDQFVYNLMTSIITLFFTTIGAIFVFTSMSPMMIGMIIPFLILVVIISFMQDKKVTKSFSELRKMNNKLMEDTEDVISDLSMKIKPGKMTAIVGPSGSGKSTIAGLIPRNYDVDRGTIKIDGVNVKDYDLAHLRKSIGVVQQDIYLFYGTICDNIKYACPDASMEEVINAAKLANADGFISELPNGYNSNIGDRGVKLSGGQKQRIAIARIFLENPPIIIFDEATSALDNESEKEVQKAMENLSKKRTTIVIAHRLSTIRNADEIMYLSKNGIEEQGTHDELIEKDGLYAKLYKSSVK